MASQSIPIPTHLVTTFCNTRATREPFGDQGREFCVSVRPRSFFDVQLLMGIELWSIRELLRKGRV